MNKKIIKHGMSKHKALAIGIPLGVVGTTAAVVTPIAIVLNTKPVKQESKPSTPTQDFVRVRQLSIQNSAKMQINKHTTLFLSISPSNANNKKVLWGSSDPSIASIDENGVIYGKKPGTVTITAISHDNVNASGRCELTVISDSPPVIHPTSINMSKSETLVQKQYVSLYPNVLPIDATNKQLSWLSSDENIATVSQTGLIHALNPGNVIITATCLDNSAVSASCSVTIIKDDPKVDVISVSMLENVSIQEQNKFKLEPTITPTNATNKDLIWRSSDTNVAIVGQDGTITAIEHGNAVITATSVDNPTISCNCSVSVTKAPEEKIPVQEIVLTPAISIQEKQSITLHAEVQPKNATNKELIWETSDKSKATVSPSGTVTALKRGTVDLTATSSDDETITARCVATITPAPEEEILVESVDLPSNQTIIIGESMTLNVDIKPTNATNKELVWESSDGTIAKVNDGNVTALKEGFCTISARSVSNDNAIGSCHITVIENSPKHVTDVIIESKVNLNTNESLTLTPKVLPEDAKDKTVTWSSTNNEVVTVNNTGLITGLKEGSASIICRSNDNPLIYGTCNVNVAEAPYTGPTFKIVDNVLFGFNEGVTNKVIQERFSDGNLIIDECVEIASDAFNNKLPSFINKITLPSNMVKIDSNAFANNQSLKTLGFYDGKNLGDWLLQTLGSYAFYNTGLESFALPANIVEIGNSCFEKCQNLNYIDCRLLKNSDNISLLENSFNNLALSGKVIVRKASADGWKTKLANAGLTQPDIQGQFSSNWSVEEFETLKIIDNVCYGFKTDIEPYLQFLIKEDSQQLTIPNTVTTINAQAFKNNQNIENLILKSSVVDIGNNAFEGCVKLNKIDVKDYASVPGWSGTNIFKDCAEKGLVDIKNNLKTYWETLFKSNSGLAIDDDHWVIGNNQPELENCMVVRAKASSTITIKTYQQNKTIDLKSKTNSGEWVSARSSYTLSKDDVVYFRGNNPNGWCSNDKLDYKNFIIKGDVSLEGNVMGLINDAIYTSDTIPNNCCFYSLFHTSPGITNIEHDFLPAVNIKSQCYYSMFADNTGLLNIPYLPAETLAKSCYGSMFTGCSNIQSIISLPASILSDYCYRYMFRECKSIRNVYIWAIELSTSSFHSTFYDCVSLNNIEVLNMNFSDTSITNNWLYNVASSGTFTLPSSVALPASKNPSTIPSWWTIVQK